MSLTATRYQAVTVPNEFVFGIAALTDPGRKRSNNEDAVGVDLGCGVAVLADGMGAHAAGEVASQFAVRELLRDLPNLVARSSDGNALAVGLRELAQRVNDQMRAHVRANPDCEGMGSTVVVAAPIGHQLVIGHLGDSRAYLWRQGVLQRLTLDHRWLDEQIAMGVLTPEKARESRQTNALTRALAIEDEVDMAIHVEDVEHNDIVLLCSDGLSDLVPQEVIQHVLTHGSGYPAAMAQQLLDMANQAGGKDNISVVIMRAYRA